jgi:L-seryl-tRNA(Ser) seleniumtransferase
MSVTADLSERMRQLPAVDTVLGWSQIAALVVAYGHAAVVDVIRNVISAERQHILTDPDYSVAEKQMTRTIAELVAASAAPTLYPLINATGIIVHTNLGRAPLSDAALKAIDAVGRGYSTLEYNVEEGKRGSRSVHSAELIQRVTGAESATVVNNAAAGVLLMLTALCQGREVIISRGQLVEIGGGFRVPDVMAQSGAQLVEVGTTNRTHVRDYENAITENTAAILVAHHSNFKIIGFTTEPELAELAELAHKHNILLLFDQGSGAMLDTSQFGLARESLVQESVVAGCDVVVFSGDKLLGGPQAGIMCGRSDLIETIKRHPLARAVRPDKLCLAGLMATLQAFARGSVTDEIPVWQMIALSAESITSTANNWAQHFAQSGIPVDLIDGESMVGGGSLPGQTLPTTLLAFTGFAAETLAKALRDQGIIGRIQNDTVVLDPRTVLPHQIDDLLQLTRQAVQSIQATAQD